MKLATDFEGNEKGVWVVKDDGQSDCHVYMTEDYLVLGQNQDYAAMVGDNAFTPLCVWFNQEKAFVQYKDENTGECKTREFNIGEFHKLFVRFLEDCRMYCVAKS